MTTELLLN